jgi:hypothetical protein
MYIQSLTWRVKDNFGFIARCPFCTHKYEVNDGYADIFYQLEIFPNRQCPKCHLNQFAQRYVYRNGQEMRVITTLYQDLTIYMDVILGGKNHEHNRRAVVSGL